MAMHCDGRDGVAIVLGGRLRERSVTGHFEAGSLSVVAKPADALHATEFGPDGAALLAIRMPVGAPSPAAQPRAPLPGWVWRSQPDLLPEITGVLQAAGEFDRDTGRERADALGEAVALLVDAMTGTRPERRSLRAGPRWLERVRERLVETHAEPNPVALLAADAGVSPTHLTRCFNQCYGHSVSEYRTLLRVRTAARLLASHDLPMAGVAVEAGFHDQSHLIRNFRRVTGTTPGAWRLLSRAGR
jgi:AraC-like DNA-binding protein